MINLSALAQKLDGELMGGDIAFSQLSTDSRTLSRGDMYLALSGDRFDGNDFVVEAITKGASGAIVSKELDIDCPMLRVPDTHAALGEIAKLNRQRSSAKVIALTGSQGKTTVKEMIHRMLSNQASTLVTHANLNNTIGVPLTLLQLNEKHGFAVIEMGANRAGEIAFSADKALPNIALITNASSAHIEGFGSLQGIVEAKGEIIDSVSPQGTVILNLMDPNANQWIERAKSRRVVLFSACNSNNGPVEYFASNVLMGNGGCVSFTLNSPAGKCRLSLNLLGCHNVGNAVAAASAAMEAGATLDDIQKGLANLGPIGGRLEAKCALFGSRLIDDTYNASPNSFFVAIDVLMSFSGMRVLIAGDMKELGQESASAHALVGKYAAIAGVDEFWAVGEKSRFAVQAFGDNARHFASKSDLLAACKEIASNDTVFLVKGSRDTQMETIVSELT